jgi:hypothetical protein
MPKQLLVSSESPVQRNPKNPPLNLHPWNSKSLQKASERNECSQTKFLKTQNKSNESHKMRSWEELVAPKKTPTCCQTRGACQDCDLRKNLDKNVPAAAMILSGSLSLSRNQSNTHQNRKTPPPPLSPPLAQQIS